MSCVTNWLDIGELQKEEVPGNQLKTKAGDMTLPPFLLQHTRFHLQVLGVTSRNLALYPNPKGEKSPALGKDKV